MDSKRLATLKALSAHLEGDITPANGYEFDLTGAVFRGRLYFDHTDPVPCLSILDALNPDRYPSVAGKDDGEPGVAASRWVLLLNGWVQDDKRNPTDPAEQFMASVKKSLAKLDDDPNPMSVQPQHPNYMLGGLIAGLDIEPGTVRPPDEQSAKAYFWMRVILKFTENVRDPFDHR